MEKESLSERKENTNIVIQTESSGVGGREQERNCSGSDLNRRKYM